MHPRIPLLNPMWTSTTARRTPRVTPFAGFVLLCASPVAYGHVSEQALVLLLPTDVYATVGTSIVILSALALAGLPYNNRAATPPLSDEWAQIRGPSIVCSLIATAALALLLVAGYAGSRDPLSNLLPLAVWTVWWIVLVSLHGFLGNLWRHVNPWSGLVHVMHAKGVRDGFASLPRAVGRWPACVLLLGFSAFVLADPAPDDPSRLAVIVAGIWLAALVGASAFGPHAWFTRIDALSLLMSRFAMLAPLHRTSTSAFALRIPGLPLTHVADYPRSHAVFCTLLLGIGSYDGLNETFWWLHHIGVNPLEYPGRSALILTTVTGLLLFNLLLLAVFLLCIATGVRLAGRMQPPKNTVRAPGKVSTGLMFERIAPTLVPIAFAYHLAHYLTTFLVNGQYTLVAISDPLGRGADWLGLGHHFVSTGMFNTPSSVKAIWLTQATVVTLGHLLSLILAHRVAEHLFSSRRQVVLSQIPVVIFMCAYTGFGLWLLASPKGA